MAKMPPDANSKAIPVLRPYDTEVVTGSSAPTTSEVVRLVSAAGASYGLDGATDVPLPAGVVEYIRVYEGEVITVSGQVTITQMG